MDGLIDAIALIGAFVAIVLALRRMNVADAVRPDRQATGDDPDGTERHRG